MLTVVIVDDELELSTVLSDVLAEEGFTVKTAANGRDAIYVLEQVTHAVVLLDAMMPVLEGYGVIAHFAARRQLDRYVIILYSAAGNLAQIQTLLDTGQIAAFVPKPFDLWELVTLVKQVIAGQVQPIDRTASLRFRRSERDRAG